MALPSTQITLEQFIGIKDSKGQFKTWTDINQMFFIDNLLNQEVLGGGIVDVKFIETIGDNIPMEVEGIPGVSFYDPANPSTAVPVLNRYMVNLSTDYWSQLTFNIKDKRSAYKWAEYMSTWMKNMFSRYSDTNNLIATDILYKTSLAFGKYIILPSFGGTNYSKEDYYDASQIAIRELNKICTTRNDFNLGLESGRLRIIGSYDANQNVIIGQNFISAANLSLEKLEGGVAGKVMGYDTKKTMYLGQKVSEFASDGTTRIYPKNYDLSNFTGLLYCLDSFKAYGRNDDDTIFPVSDYTRRFSKNWRINAIVIPTREMLNLAILNVAPTLAEVNAARKQLREEQVGVYGNLLADIDQATLDGWNAANDRWNSRVVIKGMDGETEEAQVNLVSFESASITLSLGTDGATRNINIVSPSIRGMSFDLSSIKAYGGLDLANVSITPNSLNSFKIVATKGLTAGQFLTVKVLRDNKDYGMLFINSNVVKTITK